MTLLLNGKPLTRDSLFPSFGKLKEFLDSLPDNEVLDCEGVRVRSKLGKCSIRDHAKRAELKGYTMVISGRNKTLYGNPRAIKAAKLVLLGEK